MIISHSYLFRLMRSFARLILREDAVTHSAVSRRDHAETTRRETTSPRGTTTPRASCGRTSVAPRHPSVNETFTPLSSPFSLSSFRFLCVLFSLSHLQGIVTLILRTRNVQGGAWKSGLAPMSMKLATKKKNG